MAYFFTTAHVVVDKCSLALYPSALQVDLGLQSNSLTGTFPPELVDLQYLASLDFSNNQMNGELPEVFWRFQEMGALNI